MAMFNSYVINHQRVKPVKSHEISIKSPFSMVFSTKDWKKPPKNRLENALWQVEQAILRHVQRPKPWHPLEGPGRES